MPNPAASSSLRHDPVGGARNHTGQCPAWNVPPFESRPPCFTLTEHAISVIQVALTTT
jgi:hypothetical protein